MKHDHVLTFGFPGRAGLLGLALAALAGCSNPAAGWSRPGVTDARRDADYAACRAQAHEDSGSRVDEDIAASRAAQGHGPNGIEPPPGSGSLREADAEQASRSIIACMTDLGYHGE